ncbi:MAG: hypothetical protein IKR81_06445, partial [Victivallales bacterium]|nr:hypothetical protein [Victivallales bacterium]
GNDDGSSSEIMPILHRRLVVGKSCPFPTDGAQEVTTTARRRKSCPFSTDGEVCFANPVATPKELFLC